MKTTSVLPFQRRDLRRLLVVIAACIGSALGLPPFASGAPPKTGSRPNLVVIMSDDKDESAGPKAEKLRENRQNARFFARIQIAGNYGKFR